MKIRNKVLIISLCFLVLTTITFNLFTLGENIWDKDTAQQLMNYDWEKVITKNEEPVIVLLLRLERLSDKFINPFAKNLNLNISENSSNNFDIKITTDQSILSLIDNYKLTFTSDISNYLKLGSSKNELDTWLTTVGNEPVSLILNEKQVKDKDIYKLELKIGVESIDLSEKKILTSINLNYLNSSSQLANISTKIWINNKGECPIAVLSKKEIDEREHKTSYYALYLTASIISADKLSEKSPLITVGNIQGLNNLFSTINNQFTVKNREMYLTLNNNSISFNAFDNSQIKKNLAIAYKYDDEYIYNLGLEYPFFQGEELYLAGNIGNKHKENESVIQFGLSDSIKLNNTEYRLTYLPFSTDLSGNVSVIDEIKLELINPEFNIWYKNISSDTSVDIRKKSKKH